MTTHDVIRIDPCPTCGGEDGIHELDCKEGLNSASTAQDIDHDLSIPEEMAEIVRDTIPILANELAAYRVESHAGAVLAARHSFVRVLESLYNKGFVGDSVISEFRRLISRQS